MALNSVARTAALSEQQMVETKAVYLVHSKVDQMAGWTVQHWACYSVES